LYQIDYIPIQDKFIWFESWTLVEDWRAAMTLQRFLVLSILMSIIFGYGFVFQPAGDLLTVSYEVQQLAQRTQSQYEKMSTSPNHVLPNSIAFLPSQTHNETVAIIVESTLYSSVSAAVNQYRQDLNNTGYNTILYTDVLSTAEELKGNLTQWYGSAHLIGAALIGRLPYAEFHHDEVVGSFPASTFICDLFLMDLDGDWTDDSPTDGIYDGHSAEPFVSDIFPEIFIGRIDPTCLSWKTNVSDEVNKYLARIHEYRTGGVQRARRALVYVDDDWAYEVPWGAQWSTDVGLSYPNRTTVLLPEWTNATDWLTDRILQDYQWSHLCAHSDPTLHAFGPGGSGSEGTVNSFQIHAAPPSFNFYNLFCCSGALWTATDNLAVTYTFSGNYSLASIGSTKTGSMMDCDYFYGPLGENLTLGQSLVDWFSSSLNNNGEAGALYLEWYYGMSIVGDPLLTIFYDCTVLTPEIYSSTHPDETSWYTDVHPHFNWTAPPDVNGIDGYYYVLDQNSTTTPTSGLAYFTTENSIVITDDLGDGTWYLHVLAKDSVGNIGEADHFKVNIDTTPPSRVFISPNDVYIGADSVPLSWDVYDTYSRYSHAEVWIDNETNLVYNGSSQSYQLQGLSEGWHVVNVTAYDGAMNRRSADRIYFIDLTDPVLTIISPLNSTLYEQRVYLEWSVNDTGSGYQLAVVYLNDVIIETLYSPNTATAIEDLSWGTYTVGLTVYDLAGRTDSVVLQILLRSSYPEYLPSVMIIAGIGIVVVLAVTLKRKQ
jgi:hypothetical protein